MLSKSFTFSFITYYFLCFLIRKFVFLIFAFSEFFVFYKSLQFVFLFAIMYFC